MDIYIYMYIYGYIYIYAVALQLIFTDQKKTAIFSPVVS